MKRDEQRERRRHGREMQEIPLCDLDEDERLLVENAWYSY